MAEAETSWLAGAWAPAASTGSWRTGLLDNAKIFVTFIMSCLYDFEEEKVGFSSRDVYLKLK